MPRWFIGFLARNTPPCKEVTRLLSEAMEHPLPLGLRVRIRLHFLICKWCVRYQKQIGLLRGLLRRLPEKTAENVTDAPPLSPEAGERIKQTLRRRQE